MLNPTNDRLDYGAVLAPPAGYSLDFAVGTTYSLDLDALVGACLSLGLSEETDSELLNNPICLLEALRATGDRVALFCESGQIHMPNKPTALYVLLEKVVFSVCPPKKKGVAAYPSFHPKMWLLRFVNPEGEYLYRFVVLSRNLTFDRSWDVTYYMDGTQSEEPSEKNEPLADFLSYLVRQLPKDANGKEKAKMIRGMAEELDHVKFVPAEKAFDDFEFLPTGVQGRDGNEYDIRESDLFKDTYQELMIMSPFLTGSVIKDFNDRNTVTGLQWDRMMLITRENSLENLKPEDCSNFELYVMKDAVVDGESAISDDSPETQQQDIHAKVYMTRKWSSSSLYLGSLNASHNAVSGNVEFMLRLKAKKRYLNLEQLTSSMFGKDEENPFQQVTLENAIVDDAEDPTNAMNQLVKELTRKKPSAEVIEADNNFSIHLSIGEFHTKGYEVYVKPLLSNRGQSLAEDMTFSNLGLLQLSEFYAITVSSEEATVERVVLIPTANLPEGREKSVVNSIISDKNSFYRYVAFLLGDDVLLGALEGTPLNGLSQGGSLSHEQMVEPALYEKMLKTAAQDPEKFKGIDYLVKTISEDGVIPEDFKQLYETFKKAVKLP